MSTIKHVLKHIPYVRTGYRFLRRLFYDAFGLNIEIPTKPYVFTGDDAQKVYDVVLSGKLHHKSGTEVSALEKEFAAYHGAKFSLATNSGTSALELALKAIGIQPGDEVIVPAYTFVATAQAVLNRGGVPVFADIDDTFTISSESLERCITKRTKAVIPVHIFGNVADMGRILTIAKEHRLRVIEDSCQAVGAAYHGQKVGSIGDVGCFSFDAQKAMFTGQGGMFVTSQKSLYTIAHLTRETGQLHDEVGSDVVTTGNTYALTEMQAALARSILAQLDALNSWRRRNYELFTTIMDSSGLPIRWYRILPDVTPSFSRLVFMVDFKKLNVLRDSFIQDMRSEGVPLKTFYPVPLYSYSLFRKRKDAFMKSRFPFSANTSVRYNNVVLAYTEQFCQQQVGMEFSPYMSERHIRYMCKTLRQYLLAHRI